MSAFLINAICAIAVKFALPEGMTPVQASMPFMQQANSLLIELLRLPTTDTVSGLLLLSYCEFGQNSESGLWQFSGMAIRMAFDLGLQNSTDDSLFESPEEARRARLLFWTLFVMDRVLAFGTGRPSSMSEDVEISLPEPPHQPPLPAFIPFAPPNHIPWCFPAAVRIIILVGRISDSLNRRDALRRRNSNDTQDVEVQNNERRQLLENQLKEFYADLPQELNWSVENLKMHAANGQGGLYLFIHVWYNAVLAFVHQHQTPGTVVTKDTFKISLSSAQMISEYLVFADLFTNQSYLASPFISQPLFIAACAFIHDARVNHNVSLGPIKKSAETNTPLSVPDLQNDKGVGLLGTISAQNFLIIYKALRRMTWPWQGIGYIVNLLEQRASVSGLDQVDFSATSDAIQSFISLPDSGIVQKHSKTPPQNPSPPTTTTATQPTATSTIAPVMEYETTVATNITNSNNTDSLDTNSSPINLQNISMDELLSNHFIQEITASPTSFDLGNFFNNGTTDNNTLNDIYSNSLMDNHHGDIKKLPQRIEVLTSKGELSDVRGTVKYIGLVDGTEGDWYGIEWDDISRGKHSGEKEGKQFFETIFPNSATFVRPSKKIYTGQSFLKAFRSKYGYSNDALEFAPNIDRITKKLSQTDQLKIASVEHMGVYGVDDLEKENTKQEAKSIRQLSVAHSLISNMEDVNKLIACLPNLQELDLSLAHNSINEWNEIEGMLINLPNLHTLKLNHNKIGSISYPTSNTSNIRLKTLILSHNCLDNWKSIDALSLRFTQLESLSLTDCPLMNTKGDVGILRQSVIARFEKLETLNLSETRGKTQSISTYGTPQLKKIQNVPGIILYVRPSVQPFKKLTHLQLKRLSIDIRMDSKTYPLTTISSITIKKLRLIIKRLFDLSSSDFKLIASMIPPPNMFGVVDEERTEVVLDDDYKDLRCNYEDIRMSTNSPPPFFNALFAGALSGVTVDLFFFPVDTLKTRLQSTQGFLQAGGFKNIYKGVGSVAFGGAPGAAAFFTTYEGLKKAIPQISSLSTIPDAAVHMLAGSGGETAACLIRVPTEVVKSRQQTMAYGSVSSLKAAQLLLSQEGLNGFYRGFGITVFREIPFTSIQFPLYEYLKSRVAKYRNRDHARPYEGALCGTIAGAVAAATTTPLDVIKTRTMLSKELAMEHLQDVVQPKSDHSAKDWAFQQDNQLRMAAALNHGTYGDSSGIMTRHRAAMAARNLQSPNSLSNGLASAPLPSSINSPLSSMYTLQTPLPIGRLPLTPTTASSSCVTRSTSPTNSVASTSQTSFSFQQQQNNSAAATPSPKDSPSSNWISNQIPGIHSLMAPSPSGSSTTSNSSSIGPRRKTKLINETRRAICVFAEENPSARQEDIASRYQIERSTVSKILKQKDKWKSIIPGGASSRVAKHRPSKFPDIESRLSAWAQECALSNHYLTDHAIREKAKTVARSLGYPEEKFKASSGWVEKFKERNNIKKGKVNGVLQSSGATPVGSLTPSESDSTTDYIGQVNPLATPNHSFTYTQQHQQQSRQIPSVGPRHEPPFVQAHQDYGLSDHHANNHLLALASAAVAVDDLNHEKYTVEQERLGHEMAWIMELKRKLEQQQPIIELIKSDAIQITRFYEQGSLTETAFKQAVEMLCPFVGIDLTYGIYDIRTYLIDRMNLILARLG
ncbi:hypothetical protein E3Q08_04330 [Wallemia mellicola]|nr:hypothetical protein E3Q08_04330 [Wallemia mellicola]